MQADAPEPKRRGRPPLTDLEQLRAQAITVIEAIGYGNATMSSIAEAAGVSTRTLHRYFTGKADIVWGDAEISVRMLSEGFARVSDNVSTLEAISKVLSETLGQTSEEAAALRGRFRLIATTPELHTRHVPIFVDWHREIANFIARRRSESSDSLVPHTTATALQETVMAALEWWAVNDDPRTPAKVVERAISETFSLGR